jgi:6-phosphogluconate dehydrogenase
MYPNIIILTGVSGSGKTTLGKALAATIHFDFIDGDDFHPKENIEKMKNNIPLGDEDRWPWLDALNDYIKSIPNSHLIIACSALKEVYRDRLAKGIPSKNIQWFHLQGTFSLIEKRLATRAGHFMHRSLLQSQFDIYEKPNYGLFLNIGLPKEENMEQMIQELKKSFVGVIGMGVMGKSLARNIAAKGYSISIFNRHIADKEVDIALKAKAQNPELKNAIPFDDVEKFVSSLSTPKKIILMVHAGTAVDDLMNQILPFLEPGDVVLDGGNSFYKDSEIREKYLSLKGVHFVGCGISGGEEGALHGPSIMPGGSKIGYEILKDLMEDIAAKNQAGNTCCSYIGKGGSGHFVKMVHNGIEYAEMQLIADMYSHLRWDQNKTIAEIRDLFKEWCMSDPSYLLEITIDILDKKDVDEKPLLDKIRDIAQNKGTGGWTTQVACDLGTPIPSITESLYARYLSAGKDDRVSLSAKYIKPTVSVITDLESLRSTFLFCRMMNHIQGLEMIKHASDVYSWNIDLKGLLQTWSGGCIIRSHLLENIDRALPEQNHILHAAWICDFINQNWQDIQNTVSILAQSNQPFAVIFSAIHYFKSMTQEYSNANMIQAQRDYFGAHTYQRVDTMDDQFFHTQWIIK